ncbi:MAG: hypothetical protein F6K23_18525 [Okeania sp. SIO2C9]|uniref:hypothetical protein n=1 Tax=Okeania sp. SIO2C9 TaxID=2607791 RepID=UPI0013BF513C|nr:hypothetical protein [Okeania sp. SIO2C9]NEQ74858.1 hypothetical protein [Okeania sp. SIO2C9]
MSQPTQGIPNIPDLTHPQELIEFGNHILKVSLILIILIGFFGLSIAIISFTLRNQESEANIFINELVSQY